MIELSRVHMRYGERTLLHDISATLEPGSFHFLTGPSGAGKTTLIRLLSLDLRPTGGEVRLWGEAAPTARNAVADLRRRIGVVAQDARFLDHLSLADNVALPLQLTRQDRARDQDMDELLDWVGLSEVASRRPPEVSGGERQRAALARAVIGSPDLILADEPTGNVDWDMSRRLLDLLVQLNQLGKTVLVATHDLALIRQARTQAEVRVLRLADGTLDIAAVAA